MNPKIKHLPHYSKLWMFHCAKVEAELRDAIRLYCIHQLQLGA